MQKTCGVIAEGDDPSKVNQIVERLEIDHQLEFGRLQHRQIGGFAPFRRRLPDMIAQQRTRAEAEAARTEARAVIERWNRALATGDDMWWSPEIRASLVAGTIGLQRFGFVRRSIFSHVIKVSG
jgi:hypothetical protein